MLWIIILGASLFLGWSLMDKEHIKYWGAIEYVLMGTTVLMGVLVGILLIVLPVDYLLPKTEKYAESIEITALKDSSNVEGSFYLGSGYIDEEQYYYYMTDTNKGKKMEKVLAEDSYIKEVDGEVKLDIYELEYNFIGKVLMFFNSSGYEYIFNVPKDTVTTEFNVDME